MDRSPLRARYLPALLCLVPAAAGAGAIIETTGTDSHASVIYVDENNVRVESTSNAATVTLFDSDADELVFIDHARRQYQRVGQDQLRAIAERMERARQQMKQRLEQIPEEHRDEMRARMEQMLPGGEAAKIRVERGDERTIAGIACQEAIVHLDNEPSHAVCVASPENLGLSDAGYRTLDRMFAFFGEMTAGLAEGRGELGPRTTSHVMDALQGVPVRSEAIGTGAAWSVSTVRNADIAPAQFRIPAGYREVNPVSEGAQ